MTLGHKSLKPLRFLSLFLAFGLGGMFFAGSAAATITKGKKDCVETFTKQLKGFTKLNVDKLDPRARCAASFDAKNNEIKTSVDSRKKLELSPGQSVSTSYEGACESSYEAVERVIEQLTQARTVTCTEIYETLDEKFPDCLKSKPADTCKDKIDAMAGVYRDGKAKLQTQMDKAIKFLEPYPKYNQAAIKDYTDDWNQLKQLRAENREEILREPVTTAAVPRTIDATAQSKTTLSAYLEALDAKLEDKLRRTANVSEANLPPISPIGEQNEAKKYVEDFSAKLKDIKSKEDGKFEDQLAIFRDGLRQNLESASDENGYLKTLTTYGPAAAPLAGTLLQNNGTNAASAIAGGSTGALPALALMGAAGAAGIAMGKKSAGSSSLGSSTAGIDGPVMTPNNKADGTEFGGSENPTGPATLPTTALDSTDNDKDAEIAAENTPAGNNAALAAALGGGASVMPGKSKTNREVSSTPSTAPAGDEALNNFGGELRPAPRPSSPTDTAGNDVTNLLGKMKDLFNMDDTFGAGMPPPDMSSGGAVHPASGGPVGGGDEYVGDDYSGADEYHADGEYEGGADEAYQGSNPMGDIEVTLFRRVHARHVKCMEKGLVLLMSQELPE